MCRNTPNGTTDKLTHDRKCPDLPSKDKTYHVLYGIHGSGCHGDGDGCGCHGDDAHDHGRGGGGGGGGHGSGSGYHHGDGDHPHDGTQIYQPGLPEIPTRI